MGSHNDTRPTLGDRTLFPALRFDVYTNHASVLSLSEPVQTAANEVMDAQAREGMNFYLGELERREDLKTELGKLIRASGDDIGLVANTSMGILAMPQMPPRNVTWTKKGK